MHHHLIVAVIASVMEIRGIEIGVEQRWGPKQTTRSDIMHGAIDEGAGGHMTSCAAQIRIMRKGFGKQRFTTTLGGARQRRKPPTRAERPVAQEIDVLNVGYDGIQNRCGWLGPSKFVYDNVMDEFAKRREPSVVPIRSEIACPSQARYAHRIGDAVVGFGVE